MSGAAGEITIATLTDSSMAGTFHFTANALTGSATGTKTITDGSFHLRVNPTGTVGPLPPNKGSKVSGMLGGESWNAANVAGNLVPFDTTSIFTLAASNDARNLSISLAGVTGPGSYVLTNESPSRSMGVSNSVDTFSNFWSSLAEDSVGTVTITSVTTSRIQGSFSATLGPAPGTSTVGSLSATGTFDLGRP